MPKVLIVDDSLIQRTLLKKVAVKEGFEPMEADGADEAVLMFQKFRPDLVLLDIIMGDKSGIEALREIKAIDSNAFVVMVTSMGAQEAIIEECVQLGANGYVSKPYREEEISKAMKDALEHKS